MYTWELQNFVNQRNGNVSREEYIKLVNRVDNPQITDVAVEDCEGRAKTIITTSENKSVTFFTNWV